VSLAGYWKSGVWTVLSSLIVGKDAAVNSIAVSGEDVYAGGTTWKNDTWVELTPPNTDASASVSSLVVAVE
jgi:hypothetical protein